MADSKREEALDNLVAALALIATGSGYNFTIGEAKLGMKHFEQVPSDKFPAAYVAGADENRQNVTNRGFRSDTEASIAGYVRVTDSADTEQLERDVSRFIEDITKAVLADPTRGGKATYTEITRVKTDKGAWVPFAGFEITVKFDYRATFAAP